MKNKIKEKKEKIMFNDIIRLTDEEISRTVVRFMTPNAEGSYNPIEYIKNTNDYDKINLQDLVYNRKTSISFKKGNIAIGFLPLGYDRWIMTGIVDVIKDNGKGKPADAKYRGNKYNFRLVVKYHKYEQNGIRKANKVLNELEVSEIWNKNKSLNDKSFPGYDNVRISYSELKNKLDSSEEWRTALKCRKGIYLITDKKSGKLYVGSAYGKDGILGRWKTYLKSGYDKKEKENGKYPNKRLKEIVLKNGMTYIKEYFQYSILETFIESVSDEKIIERESWWKSVLYSREFGYNAN